MLTISCKFSKRIQCVPGKATLGAARWATAMLERLDIADWGLLKVIISDRDRKFLSELWTEMFRRLGYDFYSPQHTILRPRFVGKNQSNSGDSSQISPAYAAKSPRVDSSIRSHIKELQKRSYGYWKRNMLWIYSLKKYRLDQNSFRHRQAYTSSYQNGDC